MQHVSVPWSVGAPAALDEELFDSFSSESQVDGRELIRWTCPSCKHGHVEALERDAEWVGLALGENRRADVPLQCKCEQEHLGRPAGDTGCGYRRVLIIGTDE